MTTTSQMAANATANVTNNSHTNAFGNNNTNDREVGNDQIHTVKELDGKETNSNGGGANNLRGADIGKRKKLKSRNIPTATSTSYSKDHLNAWLETCLKDLTQEQLSSSSEFLDYNPTGSVAKASNKPKQAIMSGVTTLNSNNANSQQQNFMNNTTVQQNSQQQHQQQPMLQPNFANSRNNSKTAPFINNSYMGSAPFSHGVQRSLPNFMKPLSNAYQANRIPTMFSNATSSFYGQLNDTSQDFASLPPIVNLLGNYGNNGGNGNGAGSSEHEINSTDVLDGSGSNPNMSRGFRFSDPCLLNPSDNDSKQSGRNTPDHRPNISSEMENNKFFVALMEQMQLLHETNSKICRNLHETKVDIEALKHAPTWGIRHRRDSLSGLSAHSQPMIFGGGFGTQSPAPTYHSGAYTPGSVTEVVREVKEAARVREDALLNRVKALVEERQWSMNEANLRMMRDIEDLKSQISFLRSDRKEANKRITHLEAENKYMRQLLASIYNSSRNAASTSINTRNVVMHEHETQQRSRKNMPHANARRVQSMNLHYGTIHHQAASSLSLEEQDEEEPLHINEPPILTNAERKQQKQPNANHEMRSSLSSSDGSNDQTSIDNTNLHKLAMSPPKFALISTTPTSQQQSPQTPQNPLQKPKRKNKENTLKKLSSEESLQQFKQQQQQQEQLRRQSTDSAKTLTTQELQQELNDAVAARQNADERIIAIEKLVKNLHVNSTKPNTTTFGVVGDGSTGDFNKMIQTHHHLKSQQHPMNVTQNKNKNFKQHSQAASFEGSDANAIVSHATPKLSVAGPITDL